MGLSDSNDQLFAVGKSVLSRFRRCPPCWLHFCTYEYRKRVNWRRHQMSVHSGEIILHSVWTTGGSLRGAQIDCDWNQANRAGQCYGQPCFVPGHAGYAPSTQTISRAGFHRKL